MTENKSDPIREVVEFFKSLSRERDDDAKMFKSLSRDLAITDDEDGDNDVVHSFQCLEECTDVLYRPPRLLLEHIINFKLDVHSYEKNGYYYTFSSSVMDFYGKGKTLEYARKDLMSFVTTSILCGHGRIYPKCSSFEFESTYCESLFKKMIDDGKDESKNPMNDYREINNDFHINFIFDKENMSLRDRKYMRAFQNLLIRTKRENRMATRLNYTEWVKNGSPVCTFCHL